MENVVHATAWVLAVLLEMVVCQEMALGVEDVLVKIVYAPKILSAAAMCGMRPARPNAMRIVMGAVWS